MKKIALLSAGAVMAGSLVIVAAPADAAVAAVPTISTTSFSCSGGGVAGLADATSTATAPLDMAVGDSAPVGLTSKLDLPSSLLGDVLSLAGGVTGSGTATGSIVGPSSFTQAIGPSTTDSLTGTLLDGVVPLSLLAGSTTFAPTVPGDYDVQVTRLTASLDTLLGGTLPLDCLPAAGSDPVVSTIHVLGLNQSSTTLKLSRTTEAFGQATAATAKVASNLSGVIGNPNGTVAFTLGGKSISQTLTNGVAAITLPRLAAGQTYGVKASFVPGSGELAGPSSATGSITVVKDGTRTVVTAPTIKRRHVEVATVKVRSTHGAMVRGTVRAVLKKGTKTLRARTVSLRRGTAKVRFGKLRKKGRYTVVATYRASQNFKRSVDRDAFKVR